MRNNLCDLFNDASYFTLAMTHRGVDCARNNQRLEFLGDRVLGLVVSDMLYAAYPNEREGDLAKRLAALVCADSVADVAERIHLGECLILSDAEKSMDGQCNRSNLGDACEALIGALYLDQGYAHAAKFVQEHWQALLHDTNRPPKDAKTTLQEWVQADGLPLPVYQEAERSGPAHQPEFHIDVCVAGYAPVRATGTSKRAAQQAAAAAFLHERGVAEL